MARLRNDPTGLLGITVMLVRKAPAFLIYLDATFGHDPVELRQQYGRDLLMMGGFDKHILAGSKAEIEREVHRLTPLVEEGGYIGFCDHLVPPDVPLENYLFYLETVRRTWGKGGELKPLGRPSSQEDTS